MAGFFHREIIKLNGDVGSSCQETHKICWDFAQYYDNMVVWNMAFMTFHLLGMSSSQLTFTPSFFRGVAKNHQRDENRPPPQTDATENFLAELPLSQSLWPSTDSAQSSESCEKTPGFVGKWVIHGNPQFEWIKVSFSHSITGSGKSTTHFEDRPTLQLWTFEAGTQQGVELTALDWWKQPEMDQYLWQLSVNLWWWWWRWRWRSRSRCGYSILTLLLIYRRLRHGRAELLQEYSKQEDKHHYKQARLAQQSGKVLTDWLERMTSWHRGFAATYKKVCRYSTVRYYCNIVMQCNVV